MKRIYNKFEYLECDKWESTARLIDKIGNNYCIYLALLKLFDTYQVIDYNDFDSNKDLKKIKYTIILVLEQMPKDHVIKISDSFRLLFKSTSSRSKEIPLWFDKIKYLRRVEGIHHAKLNKINKQTIIRYSIRPINKVNINNFNKNYYDLVYLDYLLSIDINLCDVLHIWGYKCNNNTEVNELLLNDKDLSKELYYLIKIWDQYTK